MIPAILRNFAFNRNYVGPGEPITLVDLQDSTGALLQDSEGVQLEVTE